MSNSNFPTSIDSFYDPQTTDTLATAPHHLQHGQANDAINAIETKLGPQITGGAGQTPTNGALLQGGSPAGSSSWVTSLTNFSLITPQVTTGIKDVNGNNIVGFTPIGSAVNYVNIQNNSTTNDVILSAVGSDTNISMQLNPKGSGTIKVGGPMSASGAITANGGIVVPSGQTITGNGYSTATLYNPYKFSAYRAGVYNMSGSATIVIFDTKYYDTSSNYNNTTGVFTAPVAGFYHFDVTFIIGTSNGGNNTGGFYLYKNGSNAKSLFAWAVGAISGSVGGGGVADLQLAANDTVSIYTNNSQGSAMQTGVFEGYLISQT